MDATAIEAAALEIEQRIRERHPGPAEPTPAQQAAEEWARPWRLSIISQALAAGVPPELVLLTLAPVYN